MIVDCHAHFAPEVMFAKLAKVNAKFPNIELFSQDGKYRLAFAGREPTRPVMPRLRETQERFDSRSDDRLWRCGVTAYIEEASGSAEPSGRSMYVVSP
jgi:hypothetical protein